MIDLNNVSKVTEPALCFARANYYEGLAFCSEDLANRGFDQAAATLKMRYEFATGIPLENRAEVKEALLTLSLS